MLPYAPILVWVIPLIASVLMPVASLHPKVRDLFPVVIGFVIAVFAASMLPDVLHGPPYPNPYISWVSIPGLFNIQIGSLVDPLSVFMCNIVAWIGALILLYSLDIWLGMKVYQDTGFSCYFS